MYDMPRRTENIRSAATPHFDSKRDTIISDTKGKELGVVSDFKESKNGLYKKLRNNTEKQDNSEEQTSSDEH